MQPASTLRLAHSMLCSHRITSYKSNIFSCPQFSLHFTNNNCFLHGYSFKKKDLILMITAIIIHSFLNNGFSQGEPRGLSRKHREHIRWDAFSSLQCMTVHTLSSIHLHLRAFWSCQSTYWHVLKPENLKETHAEMCRGYNTERQQPADSWMLEP